MADEKKDIVLLVTALSDTEEMIFEGILIQNNIAYLKKKKESGEVTGIIMGFSIFGTNFYVEKERYEEAAELLEAYAQAVEDDFNADDSDEDFEETEDS
ncbi:MAG: hypothetical protein CVU97_02920 [Firmicutes bacterium HGW-Firmicutes-21]|nr:MAG: hypothetical protein CVU97_02920 [Firmicutes bacterium HGW-Firmicutes-21]